MFGNAIPTRCTAVIQIARTPDSLIAPALLVSGINYDLQVQLEKEIADSSAHAACERFFETLSSFVDPFVDPKNPKAHAMDLDFAYVVRTWHRDVPEFVVGSEKQFDRRLLDGLEHQIIGTVDADGVFEGRVKAFGHWAEETCRIEPPRDLAISTRADTEVGPFDMYIASMEFVSSNTTLPKLEFQRYRELAERYSGFMVFRDGLRVLPYGRTDNDFFEIESRRSKSAGREFWNHRQMFGRLAITRGANPNLKDKAGREGLLDNRAAKTLKLLVANILMQSARRYFGSASSIRSEVLPQVQDSTAPIWHTFYAERRGLLDQNFNFKVSVMGAGSRRLIARVHRSQVIAQLRYEYALNLLQKLGVSMTRIGLDFV